MIAALAMLATQISRTLSNDAQKLKVFVEHLNVSRLCR